MKTEVNGSSCKVKKKELREFWNDFGWWSYDIIVDLIVGIVNVRLVQKFLGLCPILFAFLAFQTILRAHLSKVVGHEPRVVAGIVEATLVDGIEQQLIENVVRFFDATSFVEGYGDNPNEKTILFCEQFSIAFRAYLAELQWTFRSAPTTAHRDSTRPAWIEGNHCKW